MYKIISVMVLLCLFLFSSVLAQENSDNLMKSGMDYYKNGKLDKAQEEFNKALTLCKNNNDLKGEGTCNLRLGDVYYTLGLYESAIASYDRALEIFKGLSDKDLTGETLLSRGHVFLSRGNYQGSIKSYEEALKLYKGLTDKEGTCFSSIGDLYYDLGAYEEALKYHRCAIDSFNKAGDAHNRTVTLCKIGEDYFITGKNKFGSEKMQEALDIAVKDPSITYPVLMKIGYIYSKYSCYKEAIKIYQHAIMSVHEDKNKEKLAMLELAGVYLLNDDTEKSLATYEHVVNVSEEGGDKGRKMDALFNMADIYLLLSQTDMALKIYKDCLTFYREAGNRWGVIKTDQKLGDIYDRKGDSELAAQYYINSVTELEELRGEITSENLKESFSEKVMPVYRKVIDFFLKKGKSPDAFNYLEMSRARALLDSLIMAGADIKKGAEPALLEGDRNLQAEINYLEKSLQEENSRSSPDSERVRELKEKLDSTWKKLDSVRKELSLSSPSYSYLTGIKKSLTLEEIQKKVLKENQYILEYFIENEKINLWVISKSDFSLIEIPVSGKDVTDKIEAFRKPFTRLKNETTINNESFKEILSSVDLNNLHELYNILFKPLVQKVSFPKNSELIIVPDGILYYLPFEVLVSEIKTPNKSDLIFSNYSAARFLIEDYNIDYVPSASVLDPALRGEHKKISREYLGFGNPSFEDTGETSLDEVLSAGIIRLQGYSLKPLPGTEIEVRNIREMFKNSGDIYIRKEATEEKFKSECSSYKYLLLATHGLVNERNPMESSLAFSMNSRSSEDGFLKASEVLNLDINAELVVLSACETGLGKIRSGEGVVGLTRSFMYAGTPSIVVSLWSVDSSSTARLMEIFYKKLLSGMNKAEALRQAKLELMKESDRLYGESVSYRHPFFWAPFVFVGSSEE
ncbi:MAG: CHAT domain-containing tetratricopeptide repeat protein [Candidatus Eremiobacterota bacterium]